MGENGVGQFGQGKGWVRTGVGQFGKEKGWVRLGWASLGKVCVCRLYLCVEIVLVSADCICVMCAGCIFVYRL